MKTPKGENLRSRSEGRKLNGYWGAQLCWLAALRVRSTCTLLSRAEFRVDFHVEGYARVLTVEDILQSGGKASTSITAQNSHPTKFQHASSNHFLVAEFQLVLVPSNKTEVPSYRSLVSMEFKTFTWQIL